ncbi:two-component system response regulator [Thiocystis minor]|uniref:response regulator n=1 Tax=Thiocystis minor TaxID=61597 RepID=UPI00191442C7|nr:response regulator [Thiocystis minor]MBK5963792.1 two-component system response regulator [Thiocystis minor]
MAKLLIVEDSATDRDYLRDLLVRAGHVVMTANSGREGLSLARSEAPDLIFMDIVMDDVDGYHATRALKDDPQTVGIPVVVVSSKNQKADKMWAQLQGAKGYLVKPAAAEEVLRQIDALLGAPRA